MNLSFFLSDVYIDPVSWNNCSVKEKDKELQQTNMYEIVATFC